MIKTMTMMTKMMTMMMMMTKMMMMMMIMTKTMMTMMTKKVISWKTLLPQWGRKQTGSLKN